MKIPISIVIGGFVIINHVVLVLQYSGSSKTCDYHFDDVIDLIKRIDTGRNLIAKILYLFKIIPVFLFTTPAFLISFCQKKAANFIKNNYYEEIPEKVPAPEKIPVPAYMLKNPSRKVFCEDLYTVVLYDYFTGEEKYRNSSTTLLNAITTCEHWIENLEVANDLYYASPDESIVVTMKDKLLREFRTDRGGCPHYFGVSSVCNVYNNKYYN